MFPRRRKVWAGSLDPHLSQAPSSTSHHMQAVPPSYVVLRPLGGAGVTECGRWVEGKEHQSAAGKPSSMMGEDTPCGFFLVLHAPGSGLPPMPCKPCPSVSQVELWRDCGLVCLWDLIRRGVGAHHCVSPWNKCSKQSFVWRVGSVLTPTGRKHSGSWTQTYKLLA